MKIEELREIAHSKVKPRQLSKTCNIASVATTLETTNGNIYIGVCIDTACSIGFCAEHAAIAQMITNDESEIRQIVSVGPQNRIFPPCGRCREFMYQINNNNLNTDVLVSENSIMKLDQLLPHRFD